MAPDDYSSDKRPPRGRVLLWSSALILLILAASAILLHKPASYYPDLVIQSSTTVRIGVLQQGYSTATECAQAANTFQQAMQGVCADCVIIHNRCITNPTPRQQLLLAGNAVDVPVMRISRGILFFKSTDPALGLEVCESAARQTGNNTSCSGPDSADIALALAEASHVQMEFSPSLGILFRITLFAALVSALICGFLIWSERWHARFSHDAVDSGPQKFHAVAVPRIGGLAIACAIAATLIGLDAADLLRDESVEGFSLLALAALPAFCGGLAEDFTKRVGVLARLLLTMGSGVLAAVLVGATLSRVDVPGLDNLLQHWPVFAIAFTAFAVSGVANAINIIDGSNGLAAAYSVIALTVLIWVSVEVADQVVLLGSLTMLGAVAGFLLWNWPSGKIFLGDGGAYLLGFWLAELSVLIVARNPEVSPWLPLLVMAYPICETLYTIYRRKIIHQQNVGCPDSNHLHQLILQLLIHTSSIESNAESPKNSYNSKVVLKMLPIMLTPAFVAAISWNNTALLVVSASVFCLTYMLWYRRLSRRLNQNRIIKPETSIN